MPSTESLPCVLVGPRTLEDRICRLMYVRETDEVWAEEWADPSWKRTTVLVRHLLNAPMAPRATLERRGVSDELGELDREATLSQIVG